MAHGFHRFHGYIVNGTFEHRMTQMQTIFDKIMNRGIAVKADCHIHMVLDGVQWRLAIDRHRQQVDEQFVHEALSVYREKGYTYLRDGGDKWGVGKFARSVAEDYGITYRTPLAPICKAGHYGSFIGESYTDLREYAALVRQHRRDGADFTKIMISGLMDFDRFGVLTEPPMAPEELGELIRIAHEEGFSVMAHCNGARTMEAAAVAGVDSVEHGAYADEAALWAMKEHGTVWVPTLSTVGNLLGKGRFDDTAVSQILESALQNVRQFHAMGGLVAGGTDAGAWAVPHGCDTEGAWLLRAGVSPEQGNLAIMQKF